MANPKVGWPRTASCSSAQWRAEIGRVSAPLSGITAVVDRQRMRSRRCIHGALAAAQYSGWQRDLLCQLSVALLSAQSVMVGFLAVVNAHDPRDAWVA